MLRRTLGLGFVSLLFFASNALADNPPLPPAPPVPTPLPKPTPFPTPIPAPTLNLTCPDIGVLGGIFIASKTSAHTGRVMMRFYWKNVGNAPFVTGTDQSRVRLFEVRPGQPPRMVKEMAVHNLAADGKIPTNNFVHFYEWSDTTTAQTPSYQFVFSHDASVRECNTTNNQTDLAAATINAAFTR